MGHFKLAGSMSNAWISRIFERFGFFRQFVFLHIWALFWSLIKSNGNFTTALEYSSPHWQLNFCLFFSDNISLFRSLSLCVSSYLDCWFIFSIFTAMNTLACHKWIENQKVEKKRNHIKRNDMKTLKIWYECQINSLCLEGRAAAKDIEKRENENIISMKRSKKKV